MITAYNLDMNPQNQYLKGRRDCLNTCVMCALPFTSLGYTGWASRSLQDLQDVFKSEYPRAPGLYDVPQESHLIHKVDKKAMEKHKNQYPAYDELSASINVSRIMELLRYRIMRDKEHYKTLRKKEYYKELMDVSDDEISKRVDSIYKETPLCCNRCNTLMTMRASIRRLLIAYGVLDKNWYIKSRRSKQRKNRGNEDDRESDDEDNEDNEDGEEGEDGDETMPGKAFINLLSNSVMREMKHDNDHLIREEQYTVMLIAFFYVLAANLEYERIGSKSGRREDERFRIHSLQLLYMSFFWYTLLKVRFPCMFNISFTLWHVHYIGNITLNEANALRYRIWPSNSFLPIDRTISEMNRDEIERTIVRKTANGLYKMLLNPKSPYKSSDDPRDEDRECRIWEYPSVWNVAYMAMSDHWLKGHLPKEDTPKLQHRRYFPTLTHVAYLRSLAGKITTLDIDKWIDVLGERIIFRRILTTAQFSLTGRFTRMIYGIVDYGSPLPSRNEFELRSRYCMAVSNFHSEQHRDMSMNANADYTRIFRESNVQEDFDRDEKAELRRVMEKRTIERPGRDPPQGFTDTNQDYDDNDDEYSNVDDDNDDEYDSVGTGSGRGRDMEVDSVSDSSSDHEDNGRSAGGHGLRPNPRRREFYRAGH